MQLLNVMSFEAAIEVARSSGNIHLLLGNGFSIACRPDIFLYGKLFDRADFSSLSSSARRSFDALGTTDFEKVIRALRSAKQLLSVYEGIPSETRRQMQSDADGLREVLVKAIASSHPEGPMNLEEYEFYQCRKFLSHFKNIYTFNYDLLLYWALMHEDEEIHLPCDDGFRKPEDNMESEYVTWEPYNSHKQGIWYLHGALHIFDSGTEIQKYTWNNTGIRLIDQIRDALNRDLFPLFVAEGTSEEKLERIRHSDYLAKAYRSFSEIRGSLFVYGHSLAENDEHYLKRIEQGKIQKLFVGLHGDPSSENNQRIIKRALQMPNKRKYGKNMDVFFYDTDSAQVWISSD